jgi:S1-C subfamily serine protease
MGTGVPADVVDRMRESLPNLDIEFRQGGFLGVSCRTPQLASIDGVVPGSAADRAGLRPNDIIVGIDDTDVGRFQDLQEAINRYPPGEKIELRYARGGEIRETTVELGRLEQQKVRRLPNR